MLIDAALGHITIDETAPRAESSDDGIRITAALHGGNGVYGKVLSGNWSRHLSFPRAFTSTESPYLRV